MSEQELPFEEAYAQLEDVLGRLEEGGLGLEESLALFERGMALARLCTGMLEKAELRVEQLTANAEGDAILAPFEE